MSVEILAKLRELADKGISGLEEAIGYIEGETDSVVADIATTVAEGAGDVAVAAQNVEAAASELAVEEVSPLDEVLVTPIAPASPADQPVAEVAPTPAPSEEAPISAPAPSEALAEPAA